MMVEKEAATKLLPSIVSFSYEDIMTGMGIEAMFNSFLSKSR